MACVALKRSSEFDSMHCSPSKRAKRAASVRSIMLASPERVPSVPPLAELPRKASPKKIAAPASVSLREIQERRLGHQLEFDEAVPRAPAHTARGDKSEEKEEQPLFTFSELQLICERRLQEQAQRIREDYERILRDKLSEQYDIFVKFTHDQIMRDNYKPDALPSYLS